MGFLSCASFVSEVRYSTMCESLFSGVGTEKNWWLTTQSGDQYALIVFRGRIFVEFCRSGDLLVFLVCLLVSDNGIDLAI